MPLDIDGIPTEEEAASLLPTPRQKSSRQTAVLDDGSGRPSKYPWELWTNGEVHTIERHVDFDTTLPSMRASLYNRAERDELRVFVRKDGPRTLTFQYVPTE